MLLMKIITNNCFTKIGILLRQNSVNWRRLTERFSKWLLCKLDFF